MMYLPCPILFTALCFSRFSFPSLPRLWFSKTRISRLKLGLTDSVFLEEVAYLVARVQKIVVADVRVVVGREAGLGGGIQPCKAR
jgi:hypothetical protein